MPYLSSPFAGQVSIFLTFKFSKSLILVTCISSFLCWQLCDADKLGNDNLLSYTSVWSKTSIFALCNLCFLLSINSFTSTIHRAVFFSDYKMNCCFLINQYLSHYWWFCHEYDEDGFRTKDGYSLVAHLLGFWRVCKPGMVLENF